MLKKALVGLLAGIVVYWILPDAFDPAYIHGKKVLITGASSGIGEHLAYHYARLGANIVITARREDRLKKVIEKCKEIGDKRAKLTYIVADMSSAVDMKKLIENSAKYLGGIDHLILNHAGPRHRDFWYGSEQNLTAFESSMRVNFISYVYLTSYAFPYLEKSDSAAIGIVSSGLGKLTQLFSASYAASKFAMDGFFGSLRQEIMVAKVNITTTLCILGYIDTETLAEHQKEELNKGIDMGLLKKISIIQTADDTAWEIMKSTTMGLPEMYYPASLKLMVQLRPFLMGPMDWLMAHLVSGPTR